MDELNNNYLYPNMVVRCDSPVRKITIQGDKAGIVVEGVNIHTGVSFSYLSRKVIVASGTIETPKLLLASADNGRYKKGIGNHSDQLGRNLVVHPFLYYRGNLNKDDKAKHVNPERHQQEYDFATLMSRHFDSEEYQNKGKLFLFKSRSRPRTKLGELMKGGVKQGEINSSILNKAEFEIQAFMEDLPVRSNHVSLKQGQFDRFGLPISQIHYAQEEDFEPRMKFWLSKMKELLEAMNASPSVNKKDYGMRPPRADHAAGTCRMSADPEDGVVDKNLKVWGTDNLYIISNAVFPNLGAVNPTLTLTSLALRLAEHLKEET